MEQLIKKHENLIKVLEAIVTFRNRIESTVHNMKVLNGNFPNLINKYYNEIDTYERCINRLLEKYERDASF
jgi:hypothetical protein